MAWYLRIACVVVGVSLLSLNAFICFDPWFSETLANVGHASQAQEFTVVVMAIAWLFGAAFSLVPFANHFDEEPVDMRHVWSRLSCAFAIAWPVAFFGMEFTPIPRIPDGDPVLRIALFAYSIAGAICLLQELPPLRRRSALPA